MISRRTAGVLASPRSWSIAPILVLASSAGAADASGPPNPTQLIYRLVIAAVLAGAVIFLLARTRFWRLQPLHRRDDIGPGAPFAWFVAAIALYLCAGIAQSIVFGVGMQAGASPDADFGSTALRTGVSTIIAVGLSISAIVLVRKVSRSRETIPVPPKGLLVGVCVWTIAIPFYLLAILGSVLAYVLVVGRQPPQIAHETLQELLDHRTDPWMLAIVAGAVVGAPVLEETIYRGLLQRSLVDAIGIRWLGIGLTALLFTLAHRAGHPPVPWHALAPIFLTGVLCGLIREHPKGGLTGAISCHAMFNAGNIAYALLAVDSGNPG